MSSRRKARANQHTRINESGVPTVLDLPPYVEIWAEEIPHRERLWAAIESSRKRRRACAIKWWADNGIVDTSEQVATIRTGGAPRYFPHNDPNLDLEELREQVAELIDALGPSMRMY